ncbi:MAG: HlyD family type I secretion periplasmic adaptor subunit [Methylococcales bacterium]|nr:HlyD family type I secretion periplasmic adaptor subunit [Methylococcales bacterium]
MNTKLEIENNSVSFHHDLDRGPWQAIYWLIGSLALFVILGLIAMNFSSLDIAVNASGSVIPSSRLQPIQSLEGGIVREIFVKEGQLVNKGDKLVYIENLLFDSELGESQRTYWGMKATMARLKAFLEGEQILFSEDILKHAPDLADKERLLLISKNNEYRAAIDGAQRVIDQRGQELKESKERVKGLARSRVLAKKTFNIESQLMKQGAGSKIDYLKAQTNVAQLSTELEEAKLAVSRYSFGISQAQANKREVRFRTRAQESLIYNELQTLVSAKEEALKAIEDKVVRRLMRSPVNGVVNRLMINSVGGVAKAGDTIMEVVPFEDNLLFSVKVKPSDIAFIKRDQTALLRVTAYDSSIYGTLNGRVVRVGADAVLNEKKEPYYEVFLETEEKFTDNESKDLVILPGMMIDTSILTGKRTLLEYMLKPIVKTFKSSMQER